jgi:hypothetical protein
VTRPTAPDFDLTTLPAAGRLFPEVGTLKLALRPRFDRTYRRRLSGPPSEGGGADPDVIRFGATAGPAGLATWAVLFEDDGGPPPEPPVQRHRWRRKP